LQRGVELVHDRRDFESSIPENGAHRLGKRVH